VSRDRRSLVPLALAAAIVLGPSTAAKAAGSADPLRPLHATRGEDPAIEDDRGRQVLLRGVNVNQLGDYFRGHPALPTVIPLRERDFARIARLGFNHVRLILSWSRLEPMRGSLSRRYLRRIRQAVEWASDHDLYVVLDMHQDAWGKYIATPAGEACMPGFVPAIGWDGAPRWATLTDGLSTCRRSEARELSPAVAQAFQSFWADREGIQSRLIRTWARLARRFAADPAIAGYDLINEPNPGFTVGATEPTFLGEFYRRAIAAIRSAESTARRGFHHIAFFEPLVIWSATAVDVVPPPSFTADRNIVFAPHLYGGSISVDQALGLPLVSIEDGFRFADTTAASYGVTFWSGEWGWFGNPREDAADVREYARHEDSHVVGGAWWSWKQACGDPHVVGSTGNLPRGISPSLNRYRCPQQRLLGIPGNFRRVLSRPYPRAAPGRITALHSNPESGAFRLAGHDPRRMGSCGLRVWVPAKGAGPPRFEDEGVSRRRTESVPGGWLVSGCARGDYELRRKPGR
jgi:endoglycosylceramidase